MPFELLRILNPDTRIENTVQNIRYQNYKNHKYRQKYGCSLNNRVIPGIDGIDKKLADTRPGEYRLRNHRPAQIRGKCPSHNRNNRCQGISQGMLNYNGALCDSLGLADFDKIIAENLVVTLMAGVLGLLFSVAFAYLGNTLLFAQEFSQTLSPPAVDTSILLHASTFGWALLFCFILNLLSSGIPAWRASRVGIVNALGGRLH